MGVERHEKVHQARQDTTVNLNSSGSDGIFIKWITYITENFHNVFLASNISLQSET
jgi:hypothetical protein